MKLRRYRRTYLIIFLCFCESVSSFNFNSQSNTKCTEIEDCEDLGNAYCGQDLCYCRENHFIYFNYTNYREVCLKIADHGEYCQKHEQCYSKYSQLYCKKNKCSCGNGYRWDNGECHEISILYEPCKSKYNCKLEDQTYGICTDGICDCPNNSVASYHRNSCIPGINLNEFCFNSKDSCIVNTTCTKNVCKCEAGFVASHTFRYCLKKANNLEDPCSESIQCRNLPGSFCSKETGKCICYDTHYKYENKCLLKLKSSMLFCNSYIDCELDSFYSGLVDCKDNVCVCKNGGDIRKICSSAVYNLKIDFALFFVICNIYYLI